MQQKKSVVQTDKAPSAIGPYSQGIRAGQLVFVSGQIPLDPQSGQLVSGGVENQAHQCLKNIREVLSAGGSSLNDVVRTTIFLKDLNDFEVVNRVYGSYFAPPFPARATVQVARLPRDVAIEIDAIAQVST